MKPASVERKKASAAGKPKIRRSLSWRPSRTGEESAASGCDGCPTPLARVCTHSLKNRRPGAVVHTDGWKGYHNIAKKGYTHQVTLLSQSDDPAHKLMPRVHRVASLLKRWLLGTHQGAVSEKHVDYYLDEFTFRFNRRRSRARGLLF